MTEKLDALSQDHTWDLIDLPTHKFVVHCKWILEIKTQCDWFNERYKAYLIAKGFTSVYGIDCQVTFALVVHLSSVCTLLVVAASSQWNLL